MFLSYLTRKAADIIIATDKRIPVLIGIFLILITPGPVFGQPAGQASPTIETEYSPPPPRPYLFLPSESVRGGPAQKEYVLKRIDLNKIGTEASYETFEGLRLAKYFTVAQSVEIYQEPRPIDAYIMDAKAMRYLYGDPTNGDRAKQWVQTWDTPAHFRQQIIPLFTRAYRTEFTMSMPKASPDDPGGLAQLRYTLDYRDIFNQYNPKYNYYSDHYKVENWDTNEVLMMHAKKIDSLGWLYTGNFGYRYTTMIAKNNINYYRVRHTYFSNVSVVMSDRLELFGQAEYFKDIFYKTAWDYRPDHYFYAGEARIKSNDLKTSFIPRLSYSYDKYWPTNNRFKKWEMQFRVGRDFSEKLQGTTTIKYQMAFRNDVDNTAPTYAAPNPINDFAAWLGCENRLQYNVYDKLWLQTGLDYAAGMNMSDFDNIGMLFGLEYYAPGLIRVDFGWRGNGYYNIDDFLSCVYFKVFLFM